MDMTDEQRKAHIAALLREREGYVQYGRDDDVKAVDEQLKAYGHGAKTPAKRSVKATKKKADSEL